MMVDPSPSGPSDGETQLGGNVGVALALALLAGCHAHLQEQLAHSSRTTSPGQCRHSQGHHPALTHTTILSYAYEESRG